MPTFVTGFSAKKQAGGREARALRAKSIGLPILDFELRISDFGFFFFNPHSAINNSQFRRPARSKK
jgi:hypothetical protein